MILKILAFLRHERRYLLLFGGLCLAYAFLSMRAESASHRLSVSESPRYQAFKVAEKQLQAEVGTQEQLRQLMDRKPVVTALFIGYTAVFAALFFGGLLLWSLLLLPSFREQYWRTYPLEAKHWPLSLLLRVIVHFLGLSLFMNLALSGLVLLFPQLNTNAMALIHTGIMDAAAAFIILLELGISKKSILSFGFDLKGRSVWGEMLFGLGGYMTVVPFFALILFALVFLAQKFSYEPEPHPLVDVFLSQEKRDQWMIFFSIFLACVWGPFFEEVFFRGLCYPVFKGVFGTVPAGLLSAGFFALIHRNEFAFLPIFLLGIGLVWLYERRGNLVAPITLHIFHNCLFIGYFFTAKALMGG